MNTKKLLRFYNLVTKRKCIYNNMEIGFLKFKN